jgi:hypothetical protein
MLVCPNPLCFANPNSPEYIPEQRSAFEVLYARVDRTKSIIDSAQSIKRLPVKDGHFRCDFCRTTAVEKKDEKKKPRKKGKQKKLRRYISTGDAGVAGEQAGYLLDSADPFDRNPSEDR